jgi:hypothetical protein
LAVHIVDSNSSINGNFSPSFLKQFSLVFLNVFNLTRD